MKSQNHKNFFVLFVFLMPIESFGENKSTVEYSEKIVSWKAKAARNESNDSREIKELFYSLIPKNKKKITLPNSNEQMGNLLDLIVLFTLSSTPEDADVMSLEMIKAVNSLLKKRIFSLSEDFPQIYFGSANKLIIETVNSSKKEQAWNALVSIDLISSQKNVAAEIFEQLSLLQVLLGKLEAAKKTVKEWIEVKNGTATSRANALFRMGDIALATDDEDLFLRTTEKYKILVDKQETGMRYVTRVAQLNYYRGNFSDCISDIRKRLKTFKSDQASEMLKLYPILFRCQFYGNEKKDSEITLLAMTELSEKHKSNNVSAASIDIIAAEYYVQTGSYSLAKDRCENAISYDFQDRKYVLLKYMAFCSSINSIDSAKKSLELLMSEKLSKIESIAENSKWTRSLFNYVLELQKNKSVTKERKELVTYFGPKSLVVRLANLKKSDANDKIRD